MGWEAAWNECVMVLSHSFMTRWIMSLRSDSLLFQNWLLLTLCLPNRTMLE
ncbi:MAG: hypothetical protein II240_04915 [Bacteroidaceae bacterium]|nr:hypothetical protein [Bacteroidaceae bacterium]